MSLQLEKNGSSLASSNSNTSKWQWRESQQLQEAHFSEKFAVILPYHQSKIRPLRAKVERPFATKVYKMAKNCLLLQRPNTLVSLKFSIHCLLCWTCIIVLVSRKSNLSKLVRVSGSKSTLMSFKPIQSHLSFKLCLELVCFLHKFSYRTKKHKVTGRAVGYHWILLRSFQS